MKSIILLKGKDKLKMKPKSMIVPAVATCNLTGLIYKTHNIGKSKL